MRQLLLRQLLRDILKYLYAVFQDLISAPSVFYVNVFYATRVSVDKLGFRLFILLLSQIRLKA